MTTGAINLPAIGNLPNLVTNKGAGLNIDPTLAFPGYGGIRLAEDEASANYNSLQADLHTNLRKSCSWNLVTPLPKPTMPPPATAAAATSTTSPIPTSAGAMTTARPSSTAARWRL